MHQTARCCLLMLCCALLSAARADDDWVTPPVTDSARSHHQTWRHRHRDDIVSIGHSSTLDEGQHAQAVVSIFGSSTSAGEVDNSVVSVFGNTRVTGKVGDAAVAIMGNVYVNGKVAGNAVAVLGNVELGPEAEIRGDVVVVGGVLTRDPNAIVDGDVQTVIGGSLGSFEWLRPWIQRCLLYGRPLAFAPGLGWAWGAALGFLALYVFLALLFHRDVERCVRTLETQPGQSILAAVLTLLLTPVTFVLLCITLLGILAVPFLVLGLVCAAVFGKVVVLASIGRRCTPFLATEPLVHTVVGVIVGALIVLVLYTVPVLGFVVYKLLGILGLGVVMYTLLLVMREGRQSRNNASPAAAGATSGGPSPSSQHESPGEGVFMDERASPAENASSGEHASPSSVPAVGGATLPRAGFWIRMGALLLDTILVGILLHQVHEGVNLTLIVLAAYGAAMWKLKAATIGGIVCGLQVVRLDGRQIDWATAIVRALSCFLSLAVVGLGFLWIALDPEKQSWHDKIAGTVVVRAPKGVSLL